MATKRQTALTHMALRLPTSPSLRPSPHPPLQRLQSLGYDLVSGGTDNHLVLVNLKTKVRGVGPPTKQHTVACEALRSARDPCYTRPLAHSFIHSLAGAHQPQEYVRGTHCLLIPGSGAPQLWRPRRLAPCISRQWRAAHGVRRLWIGSSACASSPGIVPQLGMSQDFITAQ